ncbi:MAG: protein translocase subunit SecF [Alphaproteobacteria bacterium]|nr:protein translocase subunit SecF [Alphaproteobacteria bacterium]MBU0797099.1 protein translocase subunit SecF [Alphaproteobacteria bacterium]MBU0887906.1 protein translocase subunit SecF [Alphaproteobacteria bacterium]MBU1814871.1 protein translocase subunit SecF [Alphaproteobacteria bacterium]MBU2090937.1 protein translocase subunit SecF [Alphaproteobacteria bacterium]
MRPIRFFSDTPHIPFMRYKKAGLALAGLMLLVTFVSLVVQGLNFGIDFRGGTLIEVRSTQGPADIPAMRTTLGGLGLGEVALQEFGADTDVLIRVQQQDGGEGAQQVAIDAIRGALGDGVEYRRVEFVGPKVGQELVTYGSLAVVLAMLSIMLYVWFRFEWQFGVGALLTLLHDVLVVIGLFSVLQLEFSLSTLAAILTIAGYSINDTVVIYDRIRENLRKYKKLDLDILCEQSLNETLSRTLLTSGTTLLALLALFAFGGPVIREFTGALIFGIVIGTFSSIFISTPLLLNLNLRRPSDKPDAGDEAPAGIGG